MVGASHGRFATVGPAGAGRGLQRERSLDALPDFEERGWRALATPGGAGRRFYASALRDDAVMVFAGDLVLVGKAAILASLPDHPWRRFELQDVRHHGLTDRVAIVAYRVVAHHDGPQAYVARIASTYVRDEAGWRLAFHRQTPV